VLSGIGGIEHEAPITRLIRRSLQNNRPAGVDRHPYDGGEVLLLRQHPRAVMREKQVRDRVGAARRYVQPGRMLTALVDEEQTPIPAEISLQKKQCDEEIDNEETGHFQ